MRDTNRVLMVLVVLSLLCFPLTYEITVGEDDSPSSFISITENGDFTSDNGVVSGSGTRQDPYIIEARIRNSADSQYGISIQDTNKYFTVDPCEIIGNPVGIHLSNVSNGSVSNCLIKDNGIGVWIESSTNMEIFENEIIENAPRGGYSGVGIKVTDSSQVQTYKNKIFRNHETGISMVSSSRSGITRNKFNQNGQAGIELTDSELIEIQENKIVNNDRGLKGNRVSDSQIHDNFCGGNHTGIKMEDGSGNEASHNWFIENGTAAWDDGDDNWDGNWWEGDPLCFPYSRPLPPGKNEDKHPWCRAPKFKVTCTGPSQVGLNKPIRFTYTIQVNNGYQGPGGQEVRIEVYDSQHNLIYEIYPGILQFEPWDPKSRTDNFNYGFSNPGQYNLIVKTETDSCQLSVRAKLTVDWKESGIFPIPLDTPSGTLHIETDPQLVQVQIYDLSGMLVYDSGKIGYSQPGVTVNLSELDNGVYLYVIRVIAGGQTTLSPGKKLLVQQ